MKYLSDNMLNRLAKQLTKEGLDSDTVVHAIRGDGNSAKKLADAIIFKFLLEKKFELRPRRAASDIVLITSDKDLARYCEEFGLAHLYRQKPESRKEFEQMAARLVRELKNSP